MLLQIYNISGTLWCFLEYWAGCATYFIFYFYLPRNATPHGKNLHSELYKFVKYDDEKWFCRPLESAAREGLPPPPPPHARYATEVTLYLYCIYILYILIFAVATICKLNHTTFCNFVAKHISTLDMTGQAPICWCMPVFMLLFSGSLLQCADDSMIGLFTSG